MSELFSAPDVEASALTVPTQPERGPRSLRSNAALNLAGQIAVTVATLFATRSMYRDLGKTEFGLLYFSLVFNLILTIAFELGVSTTVVREVARALHSEPRYIRDLLQTVGLLYWSLYGVLYAISFLSAPFLALHFLNIPAGSSGDAIGVIRILSLGALLALPRIYYRSICRGLQRFDYVAALDAATLCVQQLGIVVIIALHGGLFAVAIWISATFGLNTLVYLVAVMHLLSPRHLVPWYRRGVVRRNLAFMLRMVAISSLVSVHTQSDKAAVGKFLPIAVVGEYGVVTGLMQRAAIAHIAVAEAALPAFSAALAKPGGEPSALSRYRSGQAVVCVISALVYGGLVFVTPVAVRYVLDADAAATLAVPIILLGIGWYMNAALTLPYMYSLAANRADITVRSNTTALFLVTPAVVLLTLWLGLNGAALSWIWYHVVEYALQGRNTAHECLHERFSAWLGKIALIGAPGVVIGGAGIALLHITGFATTPAAVGVGALCGTLYGAALMAISHLPVGEDLATVRRISVELLRRRFGTLG